MVDTALNLKRPSLFWLVTEAGRAVTELGLTYSYQKLNRSKAFGDGHPVLILPGFMATKRSTAVLRSFIAERGYAVYDWGLGRNRGKTEYLDRLLDRMDEIHHRHRQTISIIGWSLGGVFARQLAKERPAITRQVITLGSPFQDIAQPNNIAWLHTLISGGRTVRDLDPRLIQNLPAPAPVPTTAIYSKEDGIVPWQVCMEREEDELHQNIQVHGSHCGLGVNSSVLHVIEDRLCRDKSNWSHFKAKGLLEGLVYPSL